MARARGRRTGTGPIHHFRLINRTEARDDLFVSSQLTIPHFFKCPGAHGGLQWLPWICGPRKGFLYGPSQARRTQ